MPDRHGLAWSRALVALLILMSPHILIRAQSADTLQLAQQLSAEKAFSESIALLSAYQDARGDFTSLRMLAETYYWQNEMQAAEQLYREALKKYPEQYRVHLELGRVLMAQNRLKDARLQLFHFLNYLPEHAEANYLVGVTYYWRGNFLRARDYVATALRYEPDNAEAAQVLRDLRLATAPMLDIDLMAFRDDQPLDAIGADAGIGVYRSVALAPQVKAGFCYFGESADRSLLDLGIANTFTWWQAGVQLTTGVGLVLAEGAGSEVSWEVQAQKKFGKGYAFAGYADYKPYTWTLSSLSTIPFIHTYQLSFARSGQDRFQMELAYRHQQYPDDIRAFTAYGWALTPPLSLGPLRLSVGYSYTYSDANDNLFVPEKTLEEILEDYPDIHIEGVFDPFYTPEENEIHAVLGNIVYSAGDWAAGLNASVGIAATAQHPYLFLDMQGEEVVIAQGFYSEEYTPVTLDGHLQWRASETATLTLRYRYLSGLFYEHQSLSLQVAKKFLRDGH